MSEPHVIPDITDRLGKFWRQPDRSRVLVDSVHALMTTATFDALHEYSSSMPSGVYPGKMWKAIADDGQAFLCWYGIVDGRDDVCSNNHRKILIVEESSYG